MRVGEHRWTPWVEVVGFETACKKHRMPAVSSELALELARTDGRDRSKRAKAKKIEALLLLGVEWELVRVEWCEERACIVDPDEAAGPRSCGRELGGERTRRETESWLTPNRISQSAACLTDRLARLRNIAHVEPRDALDPDLHHRGKVV
jgi:hypothetical protein